MALTQVASDNFNRADGALGANWTDTADEGSTPNVSSNEVISNGGGDAAAFWNANVFHNYQYSQVTVTDAASDFCGVLVRASAADWVVGQESGSTVKILWYNGGSYTEIASAAYSVQNGDILRLEAIGTTYYLYVNDALKCSGTNASAPASGKPGIIVSGTGNIDDWSGGNVYPVGIIATALSGATTGVSSKSVAVTVPSGYSNTGLIVMTQTRDGTDADRNITGIVFNTSETLTQYKEQDNTTYDLTSEIWGLINPTATTANVVVSFAGTVDVTSVVVIVVCDILQTQPDATNGATNTGNPSVAVTTVANNSMVFDSVYTKDNNLTVNSSQILLANYSVNGGGDYIGVSCEYKESAGATTMSWSVTNSGEQYVTAGASIKPYVASSTSIKDVIGVGIIAFPR